MATLEYLLRVRREGDHFAATIRQIAASKHPEVRTVIGPVSRGEGATEAAAMLAAICASKVSGSRCGTRSSRRPTTMPEPRMIAVRDILLTADVRRLCGNISRGTLIAWRKDRGFPEPVRAINVGRGRGKHRQQVEIWERREVMAWLKAHPPVSNLIVPGPE